MSNLSTKYGRKKAQANVAAAAAKAEKAAAEKRAKEAAEATKKSKPVFTTPTETEPVPERKVSKLGNGIPTAKPDVTVSEEEKRKEREKILQGKLREAKLTRLVNLDADARSELLRRKNLRAAGGKKAKGASEKEDPVVMSDTEFETKAAEILGLRPKAEPSKAMPWMPTDTSKKKGGYRREDFFGNWNSARSDRFQGGYRDPAFRESFIEGRMNGLKPGDAGYDRAYSAAKSAWSQAERQYDTRFREYGDSLLRSQRQKRIEQGGPVSLVKPSDGFEFAPNGVRTSDITASIDNAVANGAKDVTVKIGNMTFRGGSEPSEPKIGSRIGKNGVYAGNGVIEFLKPGFKREEMA